MGIPSNLARKGSRSDSLTSPAASILKRNGHIERRRRDERIAYDFTFKKILAYKIFIPFLAAVFLEIASMLPIKASAAYPNGLVGYWQFDEGSGTTASDSAGSNHGTVDGAVWDVGLVDGALRFDGIDDIVRLPNITGYGDFTMSVWFKASAPGGALFQTGMGFIEIEWHPESNVSLLYLVFRDHAGGGGTQMAYQYLLSPVDFEDTWHFVVMTCNASNSELKAYLDGSFIGNLIWEFSGWNSTLNYSNIGALKASLWPDDQEDLHFSGLIDEVAEFNRALSEEEIILYYETGMSGRSLYNIPEPISIDIMPGTYPNSINPKSQGTLPVAFLSTQEFHAPEMVNKDSLTFGPIGDEDSLAFCNHRGEDVNGDGLEDLVCHFYTEDTGFICGDNEGVLKGMMIDDTPIEGSDSVRIVPCND